MYNSRHRVRARACASVLGALLLLGACGDGDEEDLAEIPTPGMVELETDAPQVEIEQALPLDAEDVGDRVLARGTVVGTPGPGGFFLRLGDNRVIFVETAHPVEKDQQVQVTGDIAVVEAGVFVGWERDLLTAPDPVWVVDRDYFIDDGAVMPLEQGQ